MHAHNLNGKAALHLRRAGAGDADGGPAAVDAQQLLLTLKGKQLLQQEFSTEQTSHD